MKKIFIFIFSVICLNSFAQNVEFDKQNFPGQKDLFKQALNNLEEGDRFYEAGGGMYSVALDYFLKAHSFNPNNALLNFKIGNCYLNTSQRINSIKFFEKAIQLNAYVDQEARYKLGLAYQLNYEFDKAITEFKNYMQSIPPSELAVAKQKVDKRIEECNFAKILIKNPARVFIDNLGSSINSIYDDHSPVINADESVILFTSRRENTTGGKKAPDDNEFYEDIYTAIKGGDKWSSPSNPGKPLNGDEHDATIGLSPDGTKLFVYRGEGNGDIYLCTQNGNTWTKPERLGKTINSDDSHEPSASMSFDGKKLYFVSDKQGGYGAHDIYVATANEKGKWSEAVNLGATINTQYDEYGVFMHPDGKTMYFSSNGHKTIGGLDLFKTVFENGKWSEPENIGFPINTPEDDNFLVIAASGRHGYYSSAKSEGASGGQDLFMITFLGPEKPIVSNTEDNLIASQIAPVSEKVVEKTVEIKTVPITILKGAILDDATGTPILATITLTDNVKNEVIATFTSNSSTGKYLVSLPSGKNYGISVKADNYLFHSENVDATSTAQYNEIMKDIKLKKVDVGKSIVLNNIFFDYAKATLKPESYAELGILTKLLEENPTLKIEISGHTDNRGTDATNIPLSEKRAKAVVDYLVSKGIDPARLVYKGYGPSKPIATNDNEKGRSQNRRTEFKIIGK